MSCHVSPVLQMYSSTTKYYSRTTLYYKVLLQYYSALQSTTPVLLCTTKYYSTTTPVLQSTTPVLLCTTKYYSWLILDVWNVIYNARNNKSHPPTSPNSAPATQNESHDWSASHMKRHLQCAEQLVSSSNLTKYCACHEKWISCWILFTHETLFTMRGATYVTLQPHQILRLPRKMTFQNLRQICWKRLKCHFQCATDPRPFRDRSEHDPTMKTQNWTRRAAEVTFALARSRFYWKLQHFALRLSFQISPNTAPATKSDTWTSPNTAPATKSDTWTSPNAAPATKSDTYY